MISKVYCEVKKEEVIDYHYWSYFALKIALCMVLVSFLIFQYPVFVTVDNSTNVIYGGFLFLGVALLITVGVIIKTILSSRKKKLVDESIMAAL